MSSSRPCAVAMKQTSPLEERAAVDKAVSELLVVYHSQDYLLIRAKIDQLNEATLSLAENMMNTAVRGALKGTKIDA
jgi:molecular chaperone DnaK